MRPLWLMLLALILPLPCLGGEVSVNLAQRSAALTSIRGEFRQERHISVLSLPLVSNGTFSYDKNDGITWQTLTPITSTVKVTPEQGVTLADAGGKPQEVASSQVMANIFLGVFSGNLGQLSNLFTITEESVSNGWQLHLVPRDNTLARYLISIDIAGSDFVESIRFTEGNGDNSYITLRVLNAATAGNPVR